MNRNIKDVDSSTGKKSQTLNSPATMINQIMAEVWILELSSNLYFPTGKPAKGNFIHSGEEGEVVRLHFSTPTRKNGS